MDLMSIAAFAAYYFEPVVIGFLILAAYAIALPRLGSRSPKQRKRVTPETPTVPAPVQKHRAPLHLSIDGKGFPVVRRSQKEIALRWVDEAYVAEIIQFFVNHGRRPEQIQTRREGSMFVLDFSRAKLPARLVNSLS